MRTPARQPHQLPQSFHTYLTQKETEAGTFDKHKIPRTNTTGLHSDPARNTDTHAWDLQPPRRTAGSAQRAVPWPGRAPCRSSVARSHPTLAAGAWPRYLAASRWAACCVRRSLCPPVGRGGRGEEGKGRGRRDQCAGCARSAHRMRTLRIRMPSQSPVSPAVPVQRDGASASASS